MTDHTPTSYALYPGRNRHYVDAPADGYEHAHRICYYMAGPDGPSHFVADVIVRSDAEGAATVAFFRDACNCHDALVEACEEALAFIDSLYDYRTRCLNPKEKVRAALALAAKAPEGGA